MENTFTGAEFVKVLAQGSLKEPVVQEGMVKPSEHDSDSIMFSGNSSCTFWIRIPVEMIEKIQYISTVRCQEHEHMYVRMFLKEPVNNPAAALFAELLKQKSVQPQSFPFGKIDFRHIPELMERYSPHSRFSSPGLPALASTRFDYSCQSQCLAQCAIYGIPYFACASYCNGLCSPYGF